MAIINGIVRGIITGTMDPTRGGRIFVQLPSLGSGGAWAAVCRPVGGGGGRGGTPAGAPVGGAVWVAFENGDPDRPVVLGHAD
ncbi:phage baseplate assembly protein V [Roseomonas sp. CECT 9278]|uniref:phage baseplate assembly protein V n=1 Tax=Roseomonas sp. CECT 9278 TaxID=2845823 RepID=UPI001E45721C|nr:phage baseplate assembly protein V [Roseomonas sp. CECT 9278]CAH0250281.1 hypothetical protein ROS9278_03126 [Roseomonas sp. CECT 9278]